MAIVRDVVAEAGSASSSPFPGQRSRSAADTLKSLDDARCSCRAEPRSIALGRSASLVSTNFVARNRPASAMQRGTPQKVGAPEKRSIEEGRLIDDARAAAHRVECRGLRLAVAFRSRFRASELDQFGLVLVPKPFQMVALCSSPCANESRWSSLVSARRANGAQRAHPAR